MHAMATKLECGSPMLYGDARVDWLPPFSSMARIVWTYLGGWIAMRRLLAGSPWRAMRATVPSREPGVHAVHAWYRYLDHSITLYATLEGIARVTRLLGVRSIDAVCRYALDSIERTARVVGDAFALGNVEKYRHRLDGTRMARDG